MPDIVINVAHVAKSFGGKAALDDVSFSIARGEMVALIGASGSGKSTLIRAAAGLVGIDTAPQTGDQPRAEGSIVILGESMQRNGRIASAAGRLRSHVGVIFQQFNLVPRLSVLTNVLIGCLGRTPRWRGTLGLFTRAEQRRAMAALARVGIADQALKRGSQLSGGQQQRAAIARALVQGADVIIADEPIASLDPSSARRVMDILADLNRRDGITVLVSLHQVEFAVKYCPRTIALRAGCVVYDGPSTALTPAFLANLYGEESESLFVPSLLPAAPDVDSRPVSVPSPERVRARNDDFAPAAT